jgi:hypothetical protein
MERVRIPQRPTISGLGEQLCDLKEQTGLTLNELSVFSAQNDPYRFGTLTQKRDAAWLRAMMDAAEITSPIHLRGLHYVLVTKRVIKPNGLPYKNTGRDWFWMFDTVSKPARWLGYIPFDRIVDERNDAPVIRPAAMWRDPEPFRWLTSAPDLSTFDKRGLRPRADLGEAESPQRYRLAFFGEKTSLEAVLGPLAEEYNADLYLAAGEQTISGIYRLARDAVADGRELIVFVFADCDPAGWQMAVSIAHKVRAFRDLQFPKLRYRVFAPALTVAQVNSLGLPSTPLKETERRADRWKEAFGVEQTEIDALATLQPDDLERITRLAIEPFFDATLEQRIAAAQADWRRSAQRRLDAAVARTVGYAQLRSDAVTALAQAQTALAALERATDELVVDLPEFAMPEATPDDDEADGPLVSSDMDLQEHIMQLKKRKAYE